MFSVCIVHIHANFMGVIVQGTVLLGEWFRGNCLADNIPGVIALGGFYRGNSMGESCSEGQKSGGYCPGGISW